MPLHDWTRVPDNIFHNFHVGWLWNLAGALNSSVLPSGYIARAEEYVGPFEADVLALELGSAERNPTPPGAQGLVPTVTISPPRFLPRKERRIAIFSSRDERRVSVMEVVSPGNKDSAARAEWFERKKLEYLEGGLHLLLIDLLPATNAVPQGFGSLLVRKLGSGEPYPHAGRESASFECAIEPPGVRVYGTELTLGDALPSVPLFLEPGTHVQVPLEPTYQETLQRLPAVDRTRLGA